MKSWTLVMTASVALSMAALTPTQAQVAKCTPQPDLTVGCTHDGKFCGYHMNGIWEDVECGVDDTLGRSDGGDGSGTGSTDPPNGDGAPPSGYKAAGSAPACIRASPTGFSLGCATATIGDKNGVCDPTCHVTLLADLKVNGDVCGLFTSKLSSDGPMSACSTAATPIEIWRTGTFTLPAPGVYRTEGKVCARLHPSVEAGEDCQPVRAYFAVGCSQSTCPGGVQTFATVGIVQPLVNTLERLPQMPDCSDTLVAYEEPFEIHTLECPPGG